MSPVARLCTIPIPPTNDHSAPSQIKMPPERGGMTHVVASLICSDPFPSRVIKPVPSFSIEQAYPSVAVAARGRVSVMVPVHRRCSLLWVLSRVVVAERLEVFPNIVPEPLPKTLSSVQIVASALSFKTNLIAPI